MTRRSTALVLTIGILLILTVNGCGAALGSPRYAVVAVGPGAAIKVDTATGKTWIFAPSAAAKWRPIGTDTEEFK